MTCLTSVEMLMAYSRPLSCILCEQEFLVTIATRSSPLDNVHCKNPIWFMFTDNEDDDDDFDDGKKDTGRRRRGQGGDERDRPLPPLLARVNGQIEVG